MWPKITSTTSKGRQPQNIREDYLNNHCSDLTQKKVSWCNQSKLYNYLKWRGSGRYAQNIKSRICQQPLAGSYPNLKLQLRFTNQALKRVQMRTSSNRGWSPLLKMEYLSNSWLDFTKFETYPKLYMKMTSNPRWPHSFKSIKFSIQLLDLF